MVIMIALISVITVLIHQPDDMSPPTHFSLQCNDVVTRYRDTTTTDFDTDISG